MANNNNALQQVANYQSIDDALRVYASPGNAAAAPPPLYPPGANAALRQAINENRLENEDQLSVFLEQYLTTDDTGKETLLFLVAIDDILNHMRSVQYQDQGTLEELTGLSGLLHSILDAGERVPDDLAEQVNNYIAMYHSNLSGSLYSMLRQRYIEDKVEELRKTRANNTRRVQNFRARIGPLLPGLQARFRSRRARQQNPQEVHRIEVGRERRAKEAANRQARANANRRAAEAREARLKRFSQPPSQRRTRRRRN